MCRVFKRNFKTIIPLFISIVIIGISIAAISFLLGSGTKHPTSLSGMDLLFDRDCTKCPPVFVGLVPIRGTPDIRVSISIEKWRELLAERELIQIHFPGFTYTHYYLLPMGELPKTPILSHEDIKRLSWESSRRPLGSKVEIIRDPWFLQDIIKIRPKQIPDFDGAIEFTWANGLKKISFTEMGLFLPFQAPQPPGIELKSINHYTVQLWVPKDYGLKSAIPEPSRFQFLGDRTYYQFDIDVSKTDLSATFENERLSKIKDYCLIIFSTFLGIGLATMIEQLMGFIKAEKTAK